MAAETQTAFISYSREDSEFALRLAGDLKAAGAAVWLDQLDIAPGERWAKAVEDALNNCPHMLVILSPSSASSTNVDDEVSFALEEKKTVIPVLYRECKIPFRLRPFHYVDFRSDYGFGLKMLLRALPTVPAPSKPVSALSTAPGPSTVPGTPLPRQSTKDARRTWKRCKIDTNAGLLSVVFATPRLGWIAGGEGTILHTADGGGTWEEQTSGTSQLLMCIHFVTSELGWAVGECVILRTEDGGITWEVQKDDPDLLNSVIFTTPLSGWALGESGIILHTRNGGTTWTEQKSNTEKMLNSVSFPTPRSGWAVGAGGVILHTENRGTRWVEQISGTDKHHYSVTFATPELGWITGQDGTILYTENGGVSWREQASDQGIAKWRSLCDAGTWMDCGEEEYILHTEDGGGTWRKEFSGTKVGLSAVAFPTPYSGCAVGDNGTILHWEE